MSALVVVTGWVLGWLLLWRMPRLERPSGGPGASPRVTVVIPARNEVDRLPLLLDDLSRQTHAPERVVVVDDSSTDGTDAAADRFPSVDLLTAPDRPSGWTGKSWACAVGAGTATGEVLVFLDADVRLAPGALGGVLATWERRGGLVSVQPRHDIGSAPEALSLVFNVVAVMGLGIASAFPPRQEWGASGPCLAISRDDHRRIGGHAAVAADVAEDLALAARCREDGIGVTCVGGSDEVRFRMYRSARGVVEGWSKNIATGAARTPLVRAICIALWIAALLSVAARVVSAPWDGDQLAVTGALYLATTAQVAVLGRAVGRFGVAAVAWPLLVVFFVAVVARSTFNTMVTKRVRWSGRTVPIGRT